MAGGSQRRYSKRGRGTKTEQEPNVTGKACLKSSRAKRETSTQPEEVALTKGYNGDYPAGVNK